ncbi:hypothetical protein [Methylobacterium sp. AMS5]|nr:hypothetical protein [Methylobacterium sp. AMS5]AMB48229.1 hypothetical protein Y590_25005 [Methylobacterium sp. AMS5]
MTIHELVACYGALGAHPSYPVSDWKEDVANDRTRLGYWFWVVRQMDPEG